MAYYKCGRVYVTQNSNTAISNVGPSKIASFSTSLALPLVSLKASIVATESGSGTKSPSNPYTLGGFSNAVITRSGVNLWDEVWENGTINTTTGQNMNDSGKIRSKGYIKVNASTKYRYVCTSIESGNDYLYYYDKNKAFLSVQIVQHTTAIDYEFTTPNNCGFVRFIAKGSTYGNNISINSPSTDTTYHAYTATQTTLALGQTVYGGEIVLTKKASGYGVKLRVTHKDKVKIKDIGYWNYSSSGNRFYVNNISDVIQKTDWNTKIGLCEVYTEGKVGNNQGDDLAFGFYNNSLYIRDNNYTDVTTWLNAVGDYYMTYELATPIEIDLSDASDIVALVGTNNVWSDTGDIEVSYRNLV